MKKKVTYQNDQDFEIKVKILDLSENEDRGTAKLLIRNSEERSVRFSEKSYSIVFGNETKPIANKVSDPFVHKVNFSDRHPKDAKLWCELFLQGEKTYQRSGEASLYLEDLYNAKPGKVYNIDVVYHQASREGKTPIKATIEITKTQNKNVNSGFGSQSNTKFYYDSTQMLEKNRENLVSALQKSVNKDLGFLDLKPLREELKGIAAPIQEDCVQVPPKMFFVDESWKTLHSKNIKIYFEAALKTALNHNNTEAEDFIKTVDTAFKNQESLNPDDPPLELIMASKILCDAMSNTAVSREYNSDHGYVEGKEIQIEDFSIIERKEMIGKGLGDCEDSARTILSNWNGFIDVYPRISKTDEPLLYSACRLARCFVPAACLTSVTGSQLADANGNPIKVHIGDPIEKELKTGAHMTVIAIPAPSFLEMIKNGPVPSDVTKFPMDKERTDNFKIASCLPHSVCEGTGSLDPLPFVYQSYVSSPSAKKKAIELQVNKLKAQVAIGSSASDNILKDAKIQKVNSLIKDEPNLRVTFLNIMSDLFIPGFHPTGDHLIYSNGKTRGAYVRYAFIQSNLDSDIKKEKFYEPPSLHLVERETPEESQVFFNLHKHTPYSPGNYLTPNTYNRKCDEKIGSKTRIQHLEDFNNSVKNITKNRRTQETTRIVIPYLNDSFILNSENRLRTDGILADIQNNKRILSAEAEIVPINNYIHRIDLNVVVDIGGMKYVDQEDPEARKTVESMCPKNFLQNGKNQFEKMITFDDVMSIHDKIGYHMKKDQWEEEYMEKLKDLIKDLLKMTKERAMTQQELTDPLFGFRTVVALLQMDHLKGAVSEFIMSPRRKGILLPFISMQSTEMVKMILQMDKSVHEKILLDHIFFFDSTQNYGYGLDVLDWNDKYKTVGAEKYKKEKYLMLDEGLQQNSVSLIEVLPTGGFLSSGGYKQVLWTGAQRMIKWDRELKLGVFEVDDLIIDPEIISQMSTQEGY